jgi:tetratricopeptide (TPR) repeat protein
MGIFSIFRSSSPSKPGAGAGYEEWMAYGKRELFAMRRRRAVRAFNRAARLQPQDPIAPSYCSWAGRLLDKWESVRAARGSVWLAERGNLPVKRAEPYLSLALALSTEPCTNEDFEAAYGAFADGLHLSLADGTGAVLWVGLYMIFFDVQRNMIVDDEGINYSFKMTQLRTAGERLLSGETLLAQFMFQLFYDTGQELLGIMGLAATHWVLGDLAQAKRFAEMAVKELQIREDRSKKEYAATRVMQYFCRGEDWPRGHPSDAQRGM